MNYLQKHAKVLYHNGYPFVPIRKGLKHPGAKGWETFESTPKNIKQWWKNPEYTGIGLLGEFTPAIDIDIKEALVVEIVKDYVQTHFSPNHPLIERVGESPKLLLAFRTENEKAAFHKMQSAVYVDDFGVEHKLEILGKGNQFVAYHIHPGTNEPYFYTSEANFLNTKHADLQTLNAVQGKALLDWFEKELIPELGWEKKPTGGNAQNAPLKKYIPSDDPLDNIATPLDISDLNVVRTLEAIDPDTDMETWVRVGFAMYHQFKGSEYGFDLFYAWSALSQNPVHIKNLSGLKAKWKTFEEDLNRTRPVTFAYCLSLAKGNQDADEIESLRRLLPIIEEEDEDEGEEEMIGELLKPKLRSKERKKLDRYIERYVYVGHGKRVIDRAKPINFKPFLLDDFHQYMANEMIQVYKPIKSDPLNVIWKELSRMWIKSKDLQKVLDTKYAPGEGRFFKDDSGTKYANSFHFPDHRANAKKAGVDYKGRDRIDVFLNHIEYLLPIERERKWFLQWIAYVIQHPHERCPIMPIHVSRNIQGTGRSWVLRVLQLLVGEWNVNTPDVEQLIGERGNFNDHLVDCKIIACEEIRIDGKDRYKVENALKSDITDETKHIRRKYGGQSTERIYGCFCGFTNYGDAIQIPAEDRRFNVFSGPGFKNTPQHYRRLLDWIDQKKTGVKNVYGNIAQLFSYFEDMDLSDFNMSNPMDTPARQNMMQMSKSDVEEMYDNFVENTEHIVLTPGDVRAEIIDLEGLTHDSETVDIKSVSAIMRHKATNLGRVRAYNKQYRLWSLDNEQYEHKEAGRLYEKFIDERMKKDYESF